MADGDQNADVALLTYGRLTRHAVLAAEQLASRYRVRIIKLVRLLPLDLETISVLCRGTALVYILEEGVRSGGIGEAASAYFACRQGMPPVHIRCVEGFLPHGDVESLDRLCGFLPEQIAVEIQNILQER